MYTEFVKLDHTQTDCFLYDIFVLEHARWIKDSSCGTSKSRRFHSLVSQQFREISGVPRASSQGTGFHNISVMVDVQNFYHGRDAKYIASRQRVISEQWLLLMLFCVRRVKIIVVLMFLMLDPGI
jgi:hypothetical protein